MADTATITTGSNTDSLEITPPVTAIGAMLRVKADNQGTPAAGDVVKFFQKASGNDLDNDATEDVTDSSHAQYVGQVDTNATDPAVGGLFELKFPFTKMFVYVENEAASSVVVSAFIVWLHNSTTDTVTETRVTW